ncbi:MAG TPA: hypothetical protein VHA11_11935 [Bryobacteraceae bacterium]|nr:hypothetical protein [Bryobacteraceae bacterium]
MSYNSMSIPADLARLSVLDLAKRFHQEMVPLGTRFAYFSVLPLGEDDSKEFLDDPIAALPPALVAALPRVRLLFVPHLEKAGGASEVVTFEAPEVSERVQVANFIADDEAVLVFAIKEQDVADYHYFFYRAIGTLVAERLGAAKLAGFNDLLREELRERVHGELEEEGWKLKQALLEKQTDVRRDTKLFRGYARQALIDTLTLYLHGICCDIDVETGPRQLASRHVRRRLDLLHELLPPPKGYVVFPEELKP